MSITGSCKARPKAKLIGQGKGAFWQMAVKLVVATLLSCPPLRKRTPPVCLETACLRMAAVAMPIASEVAGVELSLPFMIMLALRMQALRSTRRCSSLSKMAVRIRLVVAADCSMV